MQRRRKSKKVFHITEVFCRLPDPGFILGRGTRSPGDGIVNLSDLYRLGCPTRLRRVFSSVLFLQLRPMSERFPSWIFSFFHHGQPWFPLCLFERLKHHGNYCSEAWKIGFDLRKKVFVVDEYPFKVSEDVGDNERRTGVPFSGCRPVIYCT